MGTPGLHIQPTVNLSQQLRMILNPRMLQLLKTLHLPYIDLMESINRETTENPTLEIEKPDELLEYARTLRSGKTATADFDDSMPDKEIKDLGPSLQEYLIEQIRLESLEENDEKIAEYIINNIDERGYIKDYPKVREEIIQEFQVKSCNVDKVLSLIQTLEPEGIGARNLKECLLIQVQEYNFESEQLQDIIYKAIKYHFEDLAKKNFEKIARELDIETEGVKHIADFVEKNLTPAPGLLYRSDRQEQTIIPSFQIKKEQDQNTQQIKYLAVNLEKQKGPQLKINNHYLQLLDNPETDENTKKFIKEKLEAAKIFIDNINKRHETIQKIIDIITSSQQDFFNKGYYWLNPLQQNKLANMIGVHPSTISRAVSTKYAETPQGLYPLKYMCPRNFKGFSAMQIKGMLRKILGEQKKLSDQKIADFLRETRNFDIKRRTITKYRLELGEASSYERKKETAASGDNLV